MNKEEMPSWYKYLNKSRKKLGTFHCLVDWDDYCRRPYTHNQILNAMFLEIRESAQWESYTEIIKWAKKEKRELVKFLLSGVDVFRYMKKRGDIRVYSNIIKYCKRKRLDLLRKSYE